MEYLAARFPGCARNGFSIFSFASRDSSSRTTQEYTEFIYTRTIHIYMTRPPPKIIYASSSAILGKVLKSFSVLKRLHIVSLVTSQASSAQVASCWRRIHEMTSLVDSCLPTLTPSIPSSGAIWYNANVWQREVFVEPANGLRKDVSLFYAKSIDERI